MTQQKYQQDAACNRIYYSKVYGRLNMFRGAHRSSSGALTVFAASGLYTHVVTSRCQGWVGKAAHLLRSWVRIPPGTWIFVCCECRVLSGRGLCDELITRPEESYRPWCVVVCDLETSRIGAPYIYDISSLRINDLILTLLTWRKWWAPNNASK